MNVQVLYIKWSGICIWPSHILVYFKSSLDYLYLILCKSPEKSVQHIQILLIWSFLEFKIYIYIYLFLAALGLCCFSQAFYSWGKQGLLFVVVHVFLIAVASLVGGVWVLVLSPSSAVVAHQFSCSDARESSQTRNQARAPCTGRQILIHCTTREVLEFFKKYFRPLVCWICRCRTHIYGGLSMIRTPSSFFKLERSTTY